MESKAKVIAQDVAARLSPETAFQGYKRRLLAVIADIRHHPGDYQAAIEAADLPPANVAKLCALWPYLLAWSEAGAGETADIPDEVNKLPIASGAPIEQHLFAPLFEVYYADRPNDLARLYRLAIGATEAARQHRKARES